VTHRHVGIVVLVAVVAFGVLVGGRVVWRYLTEQEDLLPGRPPDITLEPHAWPGGEDRLRFAVVGDHGTGGRNAMRVATRMAEAYRSSPYGLVIHTGDLIYYGSLTDRFEDVYVEPFGPLLDAGVDVQPVLGNHEFDHADSLRLLELLGMPGRHYTFTSGPVEFFMLDSTPPAFEGGADEAQRRWLEERLARSTARWQVVVLHHPTYTSGRRSADLRMRRALEPLVVQYGVELVLTGHDHHYERSTGKGGVVHVVSGGGAKLTSVGHSSFTDMSAKRLHFMIIDVDRDTLAARVIDDDGDVFDEFTVTPRP
jgi:3',5'-cyclic AMP phosphodiesterase CpdA